MKNFLNHVICLKKIFYQSKIQKNKLQNESNIAFKRLNCFKKQLHDLYTPKLKKKLVIINDR